MNNLRTVFALWLAFIFMATSLAAYYQEGESPAHEQLSLKQIVVKLHANLEVSLNSDKAGLISIGQPAFDAVNRAYKVTKQRFLYPSVSRAQMPDLLKNVFVIEIPEGADMDKMIIDYKQLAEVEYAQPDWQAELYDSPNDPLYNYQWPLNNTGQGYYHVVAISGNHNDTLAIFHGSSDADIDAQEVFNNPPDNTRTVIVAIIDTGVDMDHPDLADHIWSNEDEIGGNGIDDDHNGYIDDIRGWDYCGDSYVFPMQEDNDPTDKHGHGTHCSGIVTAIANNNLGIAGILADCKIMPLKFSPIMQSSFASRAIVYAADNGTDVISMSWGYPWPVKVVEDALTYARQKGVILCASAGNDGIEYRNYPASCPGVITVGATTSSDQVTSFSTYGDQLEIVAPGLSILSLRADLTDMYGPEEANVHVINNNYYIASGTSMAGPHVAGVAAYLRAISPGLTPDKAQEIIQATADDLVDPYGTGTNYPGWDKYSGSGRVNLRNALNAAPGLRADITLPRSCQIVSGAVTVTGVANGASFNSYVLEYGQGSIPSSWTTIRSSSTPVTDGSLGTWNTVGLNGSYTLRLRVGSTNFSMVTVNVVNSTLADIITPLANDTVSSTALIIGKATCPDFDHYQLEYRSSGSYSLIAQETQPVVNGNLATWITWQLTNGWYTLRLSVYGASGLKASDSARIYVQLPFSGGNGWQATIGDSTTFFPNYGDFDNNGQNEIVVGTDNGMRFFKSDGTPITTGMPALPSADFRIPAVVGDLDNDNIDDLVAASRTNLYGCPSGAPSFNVALPAMADIERFSAGSEFTYPFIFLKDIDGDGKDEIHYFPGWDIYADKAQYYIFNSDGSLRFATPPDDNDLYVYLPADLNGDGLDEFYMARRKVYQVDESGILLDSFDLQMDFQSAFRAYSLAAFDIDKDHKLELVVQGNTGCSSLGESGHHYIFAFDENLTCKPGWPHDYGVGCGAVLSYPPLFGDMDQDGRLEYLVTMTETAHGQILVWHVDGSPFAGDSIAAILTSTVETGRLGAPVLADLDGDSYPDLSACAESDYLIEYPFERILSWNRFGQVLDGFPLITAKDTLYAKTWQTTPVIGDINRDGNVDLIMTTLKAKLVFENFIGKSFNPESSQAMSWRYNRRMNSCGIIKMPVLCGDVDASGSANVSDAVYIINFVFVAGSPAPYPFKIGDVNCDTAVNVSDAVWLINYIFTGGHPPCDTNGDGAPDC